MPLSHAAARKYALTVSMCLLAATDPNHGMLTKMLCVCTRVLGDIYKGVWSPTACQWLQLTREDRSDDRVHLPCVLANGEVEVGYVPRELSCKCSLSSVALRTLSTSPCIISCATVPLPQSGEISKCRMPGCDFYGTVERRTVPNALTTI